MVDLKISAGSYDLNRFLSGGYEKDIITTIYGPAGSGKTNFCMLAAVSQAKKGKKVIFVDTEGGFSVERIKQISEGEYDSIIKNIILMKPTSFEEQKKSFNLLVKEIKKPDIGLVIVDGITMLYRLEISSKSDIQELNRELARQLRTLSEISRNKFIPILVTNQVYYEFLPEHEFKEGKERSAKMAGGDLLKYWSKCLIELKNDNGKRTAILKKHRSLPEKSLNFTIDNKGIRRKGFF
ncbi:MAG: DNA repair and recombination protein RadB [Candidatus Pacearchaeota archaeon]